jgi:hypothetical protein
VPVDRTYIGDPADTRPLMSMAGGSVPAAAGKISVPAAGPVGLHASRIASCANRKSSKLWTGSGRLETTGRYRYR